MTAYVIVDVSYALILLALAAAVWRVGCTRQVWRAGDGRARAIAEESASFTPTVHDVGPDALRLLEDLDAHLDRHFAEVAALYERVGPPGPDLVGLDRLHQAVRDEPDGGSTHG